MSAEDRPSAQGVTETSASKAAPPGDQIGKRDAHFGLQTRQCTLPRLIDDTFIENEGTCLFQQALSCVDAGIMVGSRRRGDYIYANPNAEHLLQRLPNALALPRLLDGDSGGEDSDLGQVRSSGATLRMLVQEGGRAVGLSLCPCTSNDDLVIIQLKDLAEESYFRKPSTGASDTRTVLRIFTQLRHEIGNPLNSIKMTLQVLKENLEEFPKTKVLAYIARCIGEVGRIERLLASLREFGRENNLRLREIDLKGYLRSFAELSRPQCEAANMSLGVAVSEDARFVIADGAALEQVLHNLLLNAVQARRGAVGAISIAARPGQRHDRVVIDVEDNGIGIPSHTLSLIFKPMYTTKREGSGLGLALVDRLIAAMGGQVSVQSEPERFTRFSLTLPAGKLA